MNKRKVVSIFLLIFSVNIYGAEESSQAQYWISGSQTGENIARSWFEQSKRFIKSRRKKPVEQKKVNLVDQLYLDLYAGKRINIPQKFLNAHQTIKFNKAMFNATPLMAALLGGYLHVVEYILDQGADPNAANKDDITPLHLTARAGTKASTQILLDYGADPNNVDSAGRTPLMYAVLRNKNNDHLEVIKLLLANNADRTITNKKGESALTFARSNHDEEVLQLLLRKSRVDRTKEDENVLECSFGIPM